MRVVTSGKSNDDLSATVAGVVEMTATLPEMNQLVESNGVLPPAVWDQWLWGCDLAEPVVGDAVLNKMHLLGLLLARYRALKEPRLMDVCICLPGLVHRNVSVATLTPRQLKDAVENIQVHWDRYIGTEDDDLLISTVDAFMIRFGAFNVRPFVYDDVNMRDPNCETRMSLHTIRRFVTIFCLLYRHLHMHTMAVTATTVHKCLLHAFHVQASEDAFHKHQMHAHLPPAARLLYRQDFSGFYHCVSQVVYYHFPSYDRPAQLQLDKICDGSEAVFSLAPVCELYPEIRVCYEDDDIFAHVNENGQSQQQQEQWTWVLMGKRIYLLSPHREIFFSSNLMAMVSEFLNSPSHHCCLIPNPLRLLPPPH